MRRAAATCLLVTAAALAGCARSTPAATPAAAPSAAASTPAPSAASTGPSASANPVQAWALQSSQFGTVSAAVLPMTTAIMSTHGDPAAVGKACATLATKVDGVRPEAGAPTEWGQVLADLQKTTKNCDAVAAGDSGAYDRMQGDFDTAITHLKTLTDQI
ncbi:hypothetical protein [Streptomyces rubellomurinus]|uniref:hypothetical protein n=1 Tax=Streptomyces rubellomurinus (strain ATCC 31215) TaxID=359131 RepID=UPI0006978D25|nr:hypothetical protein [Streptomyces rubellomurinus]